VWSRGLKVHLSLRGDATIQQHENTAKNGTLEGMCVLVANEPLAYREVISVAFRELRPRIRVHTAEPADLDKELLRRTPRLVVCSKTSALVESEAPAWVELYPEHTCRAVVSLAGEKSAFDEMDFETLLLILDEAERLYGSV
jgi:hypothetical protein